MALTTCLEHGQGVGNPLELLLVGAGPTVELVEDPPVPDEEDPAGPAGGPDGMGHHDDGLAPLVDSGEELQQLVRGAGIQGAGGLVGQDQLGMGDEGPPPETSEGNFFRSSVRPSWAARGWRRFCICP